MFRLPQVLQEFGKVMEHYGAFQAAMETYSKILNNFPNYRGYFHVMFRTTIVGKYIAEYSDARRSEEFINQCIDTLQFLLEALPVGIDDIHAILLYTRSLQASSNPANRFRAVGVYQSLYDACAKRKPPLAGTDQVPAFKDWIEEPRTWKLLGDYAHSMEEELIARDCYKEYVDKVNVFRKKKDIEEMNIPVLMKIAKNCASIQNYEDAARYASFALKQNHFDKEVRAAISQWSPEHAKRIQQETHAVFVIEMSWRHRWVAPGYRKRYYEIVVGELEEKIAKNWMDMSVRKELAYYSRDKWRPKFVFEGDCAKKIQRQFRHVRIIWLWQAPQRAKHSMLCTEAYRQFMKTPYVRSIRDNVYRLGKHKYVSRRHAITKILPLLALQDTAHAKMWRCFKAYKLRRDVAQHAIDRRKKRLLMLHTAATVIQCIARSRPARRARRQLEMQREKEIEAAVTVQRYIRARNMTFQHNVTRIVALQRRKREQYALFLHFALLFRWKQRLRWKLNVARMEVSARVIQRSYKRWRREIAWHKHRDQMATRIQRTYRNYQTSSLTGLTRLLLKNRKSVLFSEASDSLLESLVAEDNGSTTGAGCFYKPPGVRQNTAQFQRALNQHTIYCTRHFSPEDCVMLGAVLRHTMCRTRRLIFHCVKGRSPNYEFDMIPAIRNCRSLRMVCLLGGNWSAEFIQKLCHEIQTENPMIHSIHIEGISGLTRDIDLVTGALSNLLLDFFNYSVPGVQHLYLHGLGLLNGDMSLLAKGLAVNTSLQTLCLSLNMIEENGFLEVFRAVSSNKRTSVTELDFRWNLIALTDDVIRAFDAYNGASLPGSCLHVNLMHNRIATHYRPSREYRTDLSVSTLPEDDFNTVKNKLSKKNRKRYKGGLKSSSLRLFS
eukprot:CAMPEP_0185043286 /NCGR_PEP_ID=MMETSP1103-20130426/42818_1 /TAXON_ID=36769 /ORGANISM="Paraphysomonas bandaiensis, Strain Caron Lab Isolate" /LENGTH=888 /DNA_ID=CAMNT_0027583441 /DNA_START=499 /DNA_END=3162 /DNA_ORIENTATION=-